MLVSTFLHKPTPIFHSPVFTFIQRHLSSNPPDSVLGVTSRDKSREKKKQSFSALSITLIAYHNGYEASVIFLLQRSANVHKTFIMDLSHIIERGPRDRKGD
jgi:hypothetical protein